MFTKTLTQTDVYSKLEVPYDFFRNLIPAHQGRGGTGGAVDFMVRNQNGLTWPLRLSNIYMGAKPGRYKLVVSAGWLQLVRDRKLKPGDCLTIYKDGSSDKILHRIEVKRRRENNNGNDEWTRLV